jgi:hypothetical protein
MCGQVAREDAVQELAGDEGDGPPSPRSRAKPSKKSAVFTVGAMIGVSRSTCQSLVSGLSELKNVTRCMASPHCVLPALGSTSKLADR